MTEPDDPVAVVARQRPGRPGYDQPTIVRRAVEVFNRRGYDRTSVGDLARELGLTKSAIYHHVASKEDLLATALDEALEGLESAVGSALAAPGDAEARLRGAVRESVRVLVEHQPSVTLLLRVRGNSATEVAALQRRRDLDDRLADLVVEAVAEGSLSLPDGHSPQLVSRLLFGLVNSLAEWYRPDGSIDPTTLADAVTALAFDGLRRSA